ncbi:MAG: hypothetical protein E7523_08360 [Ruminococcaceae bacterium]|nr:hypothetical protein [Oscillospiraceae bacterium]
MNNNKDTLMMCPFYQREGGKQTIQCDSKAVMDGTAKCVHCFRSNARRDRFEKKYCMDVKGWQSCPWAQVIIAKLQ